MDANCIARNNEAAELLAGFLRDEGFYASARKNIISIKKDGIRTDLEIRNDLWCRLCDRWEFSLYHPKSFNRIYQVLSHCLDGGSCEKCQIRKEEEKTASVLLLQQDTAGRPD